MNFLVTQLKNLPLQNRLAHAIEFHKKVSNIIDLLEILPLLPPQHRFEFVKLKKPVLKFADNLIKVLPLIPDNQRLTLSLDFKKILNHAYQITDITPLLPINLRYHYLAIMQKLIGNETSYIKNLAFLPDHHKFEYALRFRKFISVGHNITAVLQLLPEHMRFDYSRYLKELIHPIYHLHDIVNLLPENKRYAFSLQFQKTLLECRYSAGRVLNLIPLENRLDLIKPIFNEILNSQHKKINTIKSNASKFNNNFESKLVIGFTKGYYKSLLSECDITSIYQSHSFYPYVKDSILFSRYLEDVNMQMRQYHAIVNYYYGRLYFHTHKNNEELKKSVLRYRKAIYQCRPGSEIHTHIVQDLEHILNDRPTVEIFYLCAMALNNPTMLGHAFLLNSSVVFSLWNEDIFLPTDDLVRINMLHIMTNFIENMDEIKNTIPEIHVIKFQFGLAEMEKQNIEVGLSYLKEIRPEFLSGQDNLTLGCYLYSHLNIEIAYPYLMESIRQDNVEAKRLMANITLSKQDKELLKMVTPHYTREAQLCNHYSDYTALPNPFSFFQTDNTRARIGALDYEEEQKECTPISSLD